MANVQLETVDSVRRRLVVEIPAQDVTQEIDRAFGELRRTANVRGFRQGKAPRSVLEKVAGERLRAEVFERLVQESFLDALREEQIEPVGQPEISTESAAQSGQPLRYSATFEVRPELELGNYEGIAVERPLRTIGDEDVDAYLEQARQSAARVEPILVRTTVETGDVATVDYEAREAGNLIGKGDDRLVEVGGEDSKELGYHLEGMEVGTSRDFEIEYPEDFGNADLAGKTIGFHATVKAIGVREVPPLDDDFAKAYSGIESLEEMKTKVREELEAQAVRSADGSARSSIVDLLLENHDFEVPQSMVDRRADGLVSEFFSSMGPRRPPASREHEVREQLRQEMQPRALQQVRANLLLEAIASREGIDIGEEEIDHEIDHQAQHAGAAGAQLKNLYQDPSARMGLRLQMLRERALDRVVEKANVQTVEEKTSVAGPPGNG